MILRNHQGWPGILSTGPAQRRSSQVGHNSFNIRSYFSQRGLSTGVIHNVLPVDSFANRSGNFLQCNVRGSGRRHLGRCHLIGDLQIRHRRSCRAARYRLSCVRGLAQIGTPDFAQFAAGDFFAGGSRSLHICRARPSVPKPQKIVDLTLSPAMIFSCERINAGIDADVANKEIRTLDKMRYLVIGSLAETTCGSCHGRSPICLTPSIPILRR